jgi:peptidyl-prolyl cis-trans isomerase SurA
LQQGGFPPQLIQAFYQMREGDITPPVQGSKGRWYIFKLTAKRTQEEKLTLDNPQVKSQISQLLLSQRKNVLNSALLATAMSQIKVENFLAQRMLQNPDNFGSLRPTSLATSSNATESKATPKPQENKEVKENSTTEPTKETKDATTDKSSEKKPTEK